MREREGQRERKRERDRENEREGEREEGWDKKGRNKKETLLANYKA